MVFGAEVRVDGSIPCQASRTDVTLMFHTLVERPLSASLRYFHAKFKRLLSAFIGYPAGAGQGQLMAGSSPSLPDGSNPSAAIVQSASDVQCSRLLKTTVVQQAHL